MEKNKEIILKGKGFSIRPYRKGDYFSLSKNANNKKIAQNLLNTFPSPYTENEAKKWIVFNLKSYKKGSYLNFIIDVNGEAAGTIGGNIHKKDHIFGLGYWLGEKYWGQGIMSKVVKIYINYIFKNFKKIVRIQAETFPWNKGSQKVLEKNGFKLEGISRKSYIKDGKIIDNYNYSKLKNRSR